MIQPIIQRFMTNMPQKFGVASERILLQGALIDIDPNYLAERSMASTTHFRTAEVTRIQRTVACSVCFRILHHNFFVRAVYFDIGQCLLSATIGQRVSQALLTCGNVFTAEDVEDFELIRGLLAWSDERH